MKKLTEKQEAYCQLVSKLSSRPSLKLRMEAVTEAGFVFKQKAVIKKKAKQLSENVSVIKRIEELRKEQPSGRPTEYKSEFCQQIIEFFNKPPYEPLMVKDDKGKDVVATDKFGRAIYTPCTLPTKEAFATSIGVHAETLLNWSKKNTEFFDAIKKAENHQKNILIQNGLIGNYEKTFAIFVAKNVTDMNDKQTVDNISSDGSMSPKKDFNDFYQDSPKDESA